MQPHFLLITPILSTFDENILPKYCWKYRKSTTFKSTITELSNQKLIKMNKAELVEAISNETKLSKADSQRAVEAFVNATTKALKKGDRVSLVGFGSFSVSKRAARTGRNPQTGQPIKISARNVAKFKAGSDLTDKIN